jgi:hypothetical protein
MKIFLTVILVVLLALNFLVVLDENAMILQNEAFDRALVSFGLAKGLNAVISLIQGTELSFTPVGVGINFSIGEVLDPFNDIVERFSWIMLAATVSLGIQKILLLLSAKIFLQVLFGVSVFGALLVLWYQNIRLQHFFLLFIKLFLFLLILRFGAIFSIYTNEYIYNNLLSDDYKTSTQVIEETTTKMEKMKNESQALLQDKELGFMDSVKSNYNSITRSLNVSQQIDSLNSTIDEATRKIIDLITIFVFQTILLPLLFLWLFIVSLKIIFRLKVDNLYKLREHS